MSVAYMAMHGDVTFDISDDIKDTDTYTDPYGDGITLLDESVAASRVIKHAVERGHWGILEHPTATLYFKGYPHSVVQQIRTHRVGLSFDVASFRYISDVLLDTAERVSEGDLSTVDKCFYFRQVGYYQESGKRFFYSEEQRLKDINHTVETLKAYKERIDSGLGNETSREVTLTYNVIQNFTISFNLRSMLHLIDLRSTNDVDFITELWAKELLGFFELWCPELHEFYMKTRYKKNRRSP